VKSATPDKSCSNVGWLPRSPAWYGPLPRCADLQLGRVNTMPADAVVACARAERAERADSHAPKCLLRLLLRRQPFGPAPFSASLRSRSLMWGRPHSACSALSGGKRVSAASTYIVLTRPSAVVGESDMSKRALQDLILPTFWRAFSCLANISSSIHRRLRDRPRIWARFDCGHVTCSGALFSALAGWAVRARTTTA